MTCAAPGMCGLAYGYTSCQDQCAAANTRWPVAAFPSRTPPPSISNRQAVAASSSPPRAAWLSTAARVNSGVR